MWATIATVVILLGAVVVAWFQLQHIAANRKTEVAMRLYELFRDREADRALIGQLVESGQKVSGTEPTPQQFSAYANIGNLFEMMGIAVSQGSVPIRMVYELFSRPLLTFYDTFEHLISVRKAKDPEMLRNYVWLLGKVRALKEDP